MDVFPPHDLFGLRPYAKVLLLNINGKRLRLSANLWSEKHKLGLNIKQMDHVGFRHWFPNSRIRKMAKLCSSIPF